MCLLLENLHAPWVQWDSSWTGFPLASASRGGWCPRNKMEQISSSGIGARLCYSALATTSLHCHGLGQPTPSTQCSPISLQQKCFLCPLWLLAGAFWEHLQGNLNPPLQSSLKFLLAIVSSKRCHKPLPAILTMLPSLGFVLGPASTGHRRCRVPATRMVSDTSQEHNQSSFLKQIFFFFVWCQLWNPSFGLHGSNRSNEQIRRFRISLDLNVTINNLSLLTSAHVPEGHLRMLHTL